MGIISRKNKYSDVLNKLDPVFDFTIETCKTKDWFFLLNETGKWLNSTVKVCTVTHILKFALGPSPYLNYV